jgi:DNA modification methylase
MKNSPETVYTRRKYVVTDVAQARKVVLDQLERWSLKPDLISLGLPEVDDRYHVWRVPILNTQGDRLGETVVNAKTGLIDIEKSTNPSLIRWGLALADESEMQLPAQPVVRRPHVPIARSELRNIIIQGDSEIALDRLPEESIDLVFTSPPYFNARPDYTEYAAYGEYLEKMRRVIRQCHRLLDEGRFFVINVSAVLIRRTSRNAASRRLAVPFDLHRIFTQEGFDFIDDIIWKKPEGAGWATGRGRRFAADRNPLQYKAVPVTEYVLVYRKHTERLIDWNIRNHSDRKAVKRSRIGDDYEHTNVWEITPAHSKDHPAVFPPELAERVIRYYSFEGDTVLDPFAGMGTVGKVAASLNRKFVLAEINPRYINIIRREARNWLGPAVSDVLCIGCSPIEADWLLF